MKIGNLINRIGKAYRDDIELQFTVHFNRIINRSDLALHISDKIFITCKRNTTNHHPSIMYRTTHDKKL